MFEIRDCYRIVRKLKDAKVIFDNIYEIDSITTESTVTRSGGELPKRYTINFSRTDGEGTFSLYALYKNNKWHNPNSLREEELDWQIIKL